MLSIPMLHLYQDLYQWFKQSESTKELTRLREKNENWTYVASGTVNLTFAEIIPSTKLNTKKNTQRDKTLRNIKHQTLLKS